MSGEPTITCPRCGWTSYNTNDIREGYCGHCHDWTRDNVMTETGKDLLIVVPPGTAVRYIESPHIDGQVIVLDASTMSGPTSFEPTYADLFAPLMGPPVYQAAAYTPDDDAGVAELGGAVGRHATTACRQGAHDLCTIASCGCRCHE